MVFQGKYDSKVCESILKLKKEGKWTVKEICEICGVSRSTVKRVCSNAKKVRFTMATSGKGQRVCCSQENGQTKDTKRAR